MDLLLIVMRGPELRNFLPGGRNDASLLDRAAPVWRYIVRPIAVGGMMVGAAFTLFRMRKGLFDGLKRAMLVLKVTAAQAKQVSRNEQYMSSKTVFLLIA